MTDSFTLFLNDSSIQINPNKAFKHLTNQQLYFVGSLKNEFTDSIQLNQTIEFITTIDTNAKFSIISDSILLDKIQYTTFKYFWDFAHPTSGLARERNSDLTTVTIGGSGFGIMAIPVAVERRFISYQDGLTRIKKIIDFLKNKADKFHGAFPHWLNGETGKVIPFGQKDNGADLVETSYLVAGLYTIRQYFNGNNNVEIKLRNDINTIIQNVEWAWFRKNNENVLYWHWSPNYNWEMNFPIRGWNECLITYILAASSITYPIPDTVYNLGWAKNGGIKNGNNYYGNTLPLGENLGGPLFFSHYSFLGINPHNLRDKYANYETQVVNHSLINYNYCVQNPNHYAGYGSQCWGLTASDIQNGYTASSPTNDQSFISPTAALSSMPYTPQQSLQAMRYFYYVLGDKIWGEYGFVDAFSLEKNWFASSYLAIDQGPIIIMIENYRSNLIWNLTMSCEEIKNGLRKLAFNF
ncbi:MAG: DUF3131 domain-containing protein [Sediminibacterium sp.]|nr:DUF3131 domain-containing protein [Sediminibacterium sp.]